MTDLLNIMFDKFGIIMITRLKELIELSIYSIWALFHKYFVAILKVQMNMYFFFILNESPPFKRYFLQK